MGDHNIYDVLEDSGCVAGGSGCVCQRVVLSQDKQGLGSQHESYAEASWYEGRLIILQC